jgi:hypothetical protein
VRRGVRVQAPYPLDGTVDGQQPRVVAGQVRRPFAQSADRVRRRPDPGQRVVQVLDLSIVNVALPRIQAGLGFTPGALAWVINAYALTFGGFLLLGGRAADLFGGRRVFLAALSVFALASLACGWPSGPAS